MKILYITQILPYPPDSGGKIKTYQTLKLLGQKHQIYLACFASDLPTAALKKKLKKICQRIEVIVSPYPTARFKKIKPFIFKSLFSSLPFIVYRYRDKRFKKTVEKILEKEKFDAIHIDHLNMASYLPREKDCLWVLEEHNLESEINWGIVRREEWNKFKIFSLLEAIKLAIFERRTVSKFDYIFAISKSDRKKLIKLGAKENKVFFLPTSFKTKPLLGSKSHKLTILFVGLLAWWPNKDGLLWFYEKIFPLVKQKIPNVELIVIGKEATKEMIDLDKKDRQFRLIGYVEDLEKYLAKASVFIVPLRVGSGIRIKILTALAAGLPVVSTKKGAEGIASRSGKGIILADGPKHFARAVVKILKNRKLANKLSRTGLDFVKRDYNQQKAAEALERAYP
ncbi:glycosyltransferase family 4 protein [Patescibacteria group bacterium]|nr:glycosyltransferase family 4 protein [Patescibacteria group bacterium]